MQYEYVFFRVEDLQEFLNSIDDKTTVKVTIEMCGEKKDGAAENSKGGR